MPEPVKTASKYKAPDIYPVVVLYNQPDAPIWQRLTEAVGTDRVRLPILCDNSTLAEVREANTRRAEQLGWTYYSMGGNKGLSVAYRRAADGLVKLGKLRHYVLLLDQDTTLPADFFAKLQISLAAQPEAQVHLPLVRDAKGFMSPCAVKGHRVLRRERDELLRASTEEQTGINSGMAIQISVFTNIRHSRDYFLDYVDHAFLRAYRHWGGKIAVYDAELIQDFSDDNYTAESALKRFGIYCEDFWQFCRDTSNGRAYYRWKICLRGLKLRRRYRDKAFTEIAKRWMKAK